MQIQSYCIWLKMMKFGFKMKSTMNSMIQGLITILQQDTPILLGTLFLFECLADQLVDHHFIYLLFSQNCWCCYVYSLWMLFSNKNWTFVVKICLVLLDDLSIFLIGGQIFLQLFFWNIYNFIPFVASTSF